jgi:hypothetical protein
MFENWFWENIYPKLKRTDCFSDESRKLIIPAKDREKGTDVLLYSFYPHNEPTGRAFEKQAWPMLKRLIDEEWGSDVEVFFGSAPNQLVVELFTQLPLFKTVPPKIFA